MNEVQKNDSVPALWNIRCALVEWGSGVVSGVCGAHCGYGACREISWITHCRPRRWLKIHCRPRGSPTGHRGSPTGQVGVFFRCHENMRKMIPCPHFGIFVRLRLSGVRGFSVVYAVRTMVAMRAGKKTTDDVHDADIVASN